MGRGLSEAGGAAARSAAGMMVSAIRHHPRRRRPPLPGDGLLGPRHPPGAAFGGVVAGSVRVRAGGRGGDGGGRPAAEACRCPWA